MTQFMESPAVLEPTLQQEAPVLEVRRLTTEFKTHAGPLRAVNEMSFSLQTGRVLAIIGESGPGKARCCARFSAFNLPTRGWRGRSCSMEWTS